MQNVSYSELSTDDKELVEAATVAMENSYAPYSNFYVGAALRSVNGRIISGSNVENAAYPSGVCAERSAVVRGNAEGERCFTTIAITGKGKDFKSKDVISPCGFCRQVLNEIAQVSNFDLKVIMTNTEKNKITVSTISELLPLSFGPKDLGFKPEDLR